MFSAPGEKGPIRETIGDIGPSPNVRNPRRRVSQEKETCSLAEEGSIDVVMESSNHVIEILCLPFFSPFSS